MAGKVKPAEAHIQAAANHIQAAQCEEAVYMRAYAQLAQAEIAIATYLKTFGSIEHHKE